MFDPNYLVQTQSILPNNVAIWDYSSTDTVGDIATDGYFNIGYRYFRVGDLIRAVGIDGSIVIRVATVLYGSAVHTYQLTL